MILKVCCVLCNSVVSRERHNVRSCSIHPWFWHELVNRLYFTVKLVERSHQHRVVFNLCLKKSKMKQIWLCYTSRGHYERKHFFFYEIRMFTSCSRRFRTNLKYSAMWFIIKFPIFSRAISLILSNSRVLEQNEYQSEFSKINDLIFNLCMIQT